jgi:hypothetical protein
MHLFSRKHDEKCIDPSLGSALQLQNGTGAQDDIILKLTGWWARRIASCSAA